ncbi:MAG: phage tail assembly chaperone [Pseudomonadota bacterium]
MTDLNIPWNNLMSFGIGRLGLTPKAFWSMTPREFLAAAGLYDRAGHLNEVLSRRSLEELIRTNPDRRKNEQ